jgi:hypothetical protein
MVAMNRLETITAGVTFSDDPADAKKFQIANAGDLIRQLFDVNDPAPRYAEMLKRAMADGQFTTADRERVLTQIRRGQMECNLAAMSLACHLFHFDHHRWPASIEEVTANLPAAPHDAWGPMGYVLLAPGHPNPAERPLVYSHCNSKDGLFYPTDEPQYSWYAGFGEHHLQGGQYRDVTLWQPAHANPAPATQPLQ